ncbi:DUF6624 domain-containing protein [Flavobacterium gelatinilyticum]|uniref:DUF6624 domain-containing protein n=1 Tax=Flavobacterium gelatinilyticum TaxID=3003260 RepID=UPI002481494C|nr:DUF6624 domain-containing protein [Flavobacterium gelatinilyticum]
MKKRLLSFLLFTSLITAQETSYEVLAVKAGLQHLQGNFKNAIGYYEEAFKIKSPSALDAYKAAGMYALDHNTEKAFQYLHTALNLEWTEADWLADDPYFNYLRTTTPENWKNIKELAFEKEKSYAEKLKLPDLRKEINIMSLKDQQLRYLRANTKDNAELTRINEQINESNVKNLTRAKEIVKTCGWPKISEIGRDGENNLWLIVQHADQDVTFQQEVLFEMKKFLKSSEINLENYAFLYDRVQSNLNYKQLYGTQVVWTRNGEASGFRPILDEYAVNSRRAAFNLSTLELYALTYGFMYKEINLKESEKKDQEYHSEVQSLLKNAKHSYTVKEFDKTYDYYNAASTFAGGMSDTDNYNAAVLFAKIAIVSPDEKFKSIALDFLNLQFLRKKLKKKQLLKEPAFGILEKEPRWKSIADELL